MSYENINRLCSFTDACMHAKQFVMSNREQTHALSDLVILKPIKMSKTGNKGEMLLGLVQILTLGKSASVL